MSTGNDSPVPSASLRFRDRAAAILVWSVWAAMTIALVLYVRQVSRNVPFMDDFALVGMMSGHQHVTVDWLWSQHNEHRPAMSRLILAGLSRFVANDFRAGRYFGVALLSSACASMLLLARKLRGSTGITDAVLPLSILTLGQSESLMITFAMNLNITAWAAFALIATASQADRRPSRSIAMRFGLLLVALPLCGGSGLVMLPPLMLWLAAYVAWGWWSGEEPDGTARAAGLVALMACSAIVALYFSGYSRPDHHPPPPSIGAVVSTTLEYLSLAVSPNVPQLWRPAGLLVSLLIAATLTRLAIVMVREPARRPSAACLIAVVLSMLCMAMAVGFTRSGLGPEMGLGTRYITLTSPLLGVLYVAWLVHGPARARWGIHTALLALACLTLWPNISYGLAYGRQLNVSVRAVERSLKARVPVDVMLKRACPAIHPDPRVVFDAFNLLKEARIGEFGAFNERPIAVAPASSEVIRR